MGAIRLARMALVSAPPAPRRRRRDRRRRRASAHDLLRVEQHDFRHLGKKRVPELLRVARVAAAVNPAALVAAGLDAVEVLGLQVALVGLQPLAALGVARLRAGVNGVKDFRLDRQIVTQALEALVPVGILDDQAALWD